MSPTGFRFSVTLIRFMAGLSCHLHTRFEAGFSCSSLDFNFLPPLRCSRYFLPVSSIQGSRQDFLVVHRIFHFVPSILVSWKDFLVIPQFLFFTSVKRLAACFSCHFHFEAPFPARIPDLHLLPPLHVSWHVVPTPPIQCLRQKFLVSPRNLIVYIPYTVRGMFHIHTMFATGFPNLPRDLNFIPPLHGSWQDFLVSLQIYILYLLHTVCGIFAQNLSHVSYTALAAEVTYTNGI